MKADRNGTWTEQVRARMGWKTPAQVRASLAAGDRRLTCTGCKHFFLKEIANREGGVGNCSPYCGHPDATGRVGHATRESALCDRWEMKP